jgi:hypothetical protein
MKLLIQINNTNDFNIRCDGFILGLKDYSNFTSLTFDVEEVINIQNKYSDKEIFLSINKNIFNDEINNLKEIFKKLKNVKILFYDLGIIEINKDFNLDLVWNQDHFVTNYEEINFYNNLGVKYAYISNEITYEEIKDIVKNSKSSLLVLLVGKPTIAVSKRKLITMSNNKFLKDDNTKNKYINSNKKVIINENVDTVIYNEEIINYTSLLDLDIDYGVIDTLYLDETEKIVDNIYEYLDSKNPDNLKNIENIVGNNTNFLYSPTIYKVVKR